MAPALHSSGLPHTQAWFLFSPFSHLRLKELGGSSKALPKALSQWGPESRFPISQPISSQGVNGCWQTWRVYFFDWFVHLHLPSQKGLRRLPSRYWTCVCCYHSRLLGERPDGLNHHSQARTESSCSTGPRLRQVPRARGQTRLITLPVRSSTKHHAANTTKSELQATEPGQVGGSSAHTIWEPGPLLTFSAVWAESYFEADMKRMESWG